MNGFLGEIGKRLAERWAALLALPGLLYLAVGAAAIALGQRHPFVAGRLSGQISKWAGDPALRSVGGSVLVLILVLAGSVGVGLTAAFIGWSLELSYTLPGRRRPARWLTDLRRARYRKAARAVDMAPRNRLDEAAARADRISLVEPARPTWIGDRLRACRLRVLSAYGFDLDVLWPRLWLILPDAVRSEVMAARDVLAGSARLAGWALLYLALAFWWWPAAVVALAIGLVSWVRSRQATRVYAELVESVVDLHTQELASRLGVCAADAPLTPEVGMRLTTLLRKSVWEPNSPLAR